MKGFPFVIGTDIVQISRFHPQRNAHRLQRLAKRILHPIEFSYLEQRLPRSYAILHDSVLPSSSSKSILERDSSHVNHVSVANPDVLKLGSWLAGRWAAKEAARKAWGAEIIGYKDVRVETGKAMSSSSSASVSMVCEAFIATPNTLEAPQIQLRQEGALSISHDGDYVVATVIAEHLGQELRDILVKKTEEARRATMAPSH